MEANQNFLLKIYNWYKTRTKTVKVIIWAVLFATVVTIFGDDKKSSSSSDSNYESVVCNTCGKTFNKYGGGWSAGNANCNKCVDANMENSVKNNTMKKLGY